jgi:uncharacterized protein YbjT (DUF2867 family)
MYVLLGSNGNITSRAARLLLAQGAPVRVVGRSAASLAALKSAGAQVATGDANDEGFLASAFAGAQAVYAMIPSDYAATDMPAAQDRMGAAIANAIRKAGVKRVVNLSSVGAHLPAGTGPIAGLHRQERRLDALSGVDVLHLRPGYFFENHLVALETIRALGVYPDMAAPDTRVPMIATSDIARVVARELLTPSGHGKVTLHLHASRRYSMKESAAILGAAIGRPQLAYVQADPAQAKAAMVQHGFSASAADQFEEMSAAISDGRLLGALESAPGELAATTLEEFAVAVFAPAFAATAKAA